jgi:hypothetical protein
MYLIGFVLGFVHGALVSYAVRVYMRIRNPREPQ